VAGQRDVKRIVDYVRSLKASAKSARDDEDWEDALSDCDEAVTILVEQLRGDLPGWEGQLRSELADTYGLIGGIHKRWGLEMAGEQRGAHLKASLDAYEKGYEEERTLPAGESSTYNQINRLVGHILLDPSPLEASGSQRHAAFLEDLRAGEEVLVEQIEGSRQRDPWAYCDLATVRALLGEGDGVNVLHQLERLAPPAFVYESWLTTLEPLAEVAGGTRPELVELVNQVRRSLRLRR